MEYYTIFYHARIQYHQHERGIKLEEGWVEEICFVKQEAFFE